MAILKKARRHRYTLRARDSARREYVSSPRLSSSRRRRRGIAHTKYPRVKGGVEWKIPDDAVHASLFTIGGEYLFVRTAAATRDKFLRAPRTRDDVNDDKSDDDACACAPYTAGWKAIW
jgi:hypothetical protein